MHIISTKRLRQIIEQADQRAFTRGYNFRSRLDKVERWNRGTILAGFNMEKEVDDILKHKEQG